MDYSAAVAFLKQADPRLAGVIERVGPCQLQPEDGDLLHCLAKIILYQQLSGKAAASIHRKFMALYPGQALPADILNTPDDVLRSVGISRPKAMYLKDLARRMQEGLPTLEDLANLEEEDIVEQLTAIKGIGRWSVQMLLIFRLGRLDVLPVDDLGVRSAIYRLYRLESLPSRKTVAALGRPWQPYRSIAAWYLWRSLEVQMPQETGL